MAGPGTAYDRTENPFRSLRRNSTIRKLITSLGIGTPAERVLEITLALIDFGKEREADLTDGCLYRFGQFLLDSRKRWILK